MPYKDPEAARAYRKRYAAAYHQQHRDQDNAKSRRWNAAHPEERRQCSARYRERNREKVREARREASYRASERAKQRQRELRRKFGLSVEQYDALLKTQDGRCAICLREERTIHRRSPDPKRHTALRLAVDHSHISSDVRGLLCKSCNHGLGNFRDNPDILQRAITYLLRSGEGPTA